VNNKWVWLGIGVVLALFVFPMVSGLLAAKKNPNNAS
jgi:hypothetical protein